MNIITSVNHPLVKHLVKLRKNRRYRHEQHSVVIEGKKIVNEVCAALEAERILATDPEKLMKTVKAKVIYQVTDAIIGKISGSKTPEGVVAELPTPKEDSLVGVRYLIAFEGVSDPGNLGTLLRTALALGWQGAFVFDHGCDPFNDKALRAAKGATFRLPLKRGNWKQLDSIVKANQMHAVAADLHGAALSQYSLQCPILLVLGSEATGISEETRERCQLVTIPMSGKMESLNVSIAGGILMYVIKSKGFD